MRIVFISILFSFIMTTTTFGQKSKITESTDFPTIITDPADYNELSPKEAWIIRQKGTERSFSGIFANYKDEGTYICKQCNNPLFRSIDKFDSGTGWPSFDDIIADAVKELPDADGYRTEIVCSNCDGHLGHVFYREGFTVKQTRHCVNSLSLRFVAQEIE